MERFGSSNEGKGIGILVLTRLRKSMVMIVALAAILFCFSALTAEASVQNVTFNSSSVIDAGGKTATVNLSNISLQFSSKDTSNNSLTLTYENPYTPKGGLSAGYSNNTDQGVWYIKSGNQFQNFSLQSIYLEDSGGADVKIGAFNDGNQVGSWIDLTTNTAPYYFTFSRSNGLTSDFDNIDEVRIMPQGTSMWISVNDIQIDDPVLPQSAAPTASPVSGTTVANNSIVTLGTTTPGATIYYTTDGTTPTTGSANGTNVTITGAPSSSVTVKAISAKTGMSDSAVSTFTYTLEAQAAAPTASPVSGTTVANNSVVTLGTTTPGATIYYTTDGTTPTISSASGTNVTITGAASSTVTVKAITVKTGMSDSAVSTFTYTLEAQAAAPTASPVSGTIIANNGSVTLGTATSGATIYYTTDGTTPTTSSTSGTSVTIIGAPNAVVTVKAIAVKTGMSDSAISTFTYTLEDQAAAPTASPASGTTVANNSIVTLGTTTPGATIYYTTDGTTPTISSASGTSVTITGSPNAAVAVKAFAVKTGMSDSAVVTFTYTLEGQTSITSTTQEPSIPQTQNTEVNILVNGKVENAGTATITKVNGQTVTTVVINQKKLEEYLAAESQHAVITIPVKTNTEIVVGELNGQMINTMEQKQAAIEIKTMNATYTLPTQQININAISHQFGKTVKLQDIKIRIEIATPPADTVKIVNNAAAKGGFTIVVPPLNFTVTATFEGITTDVAKFDAYVERTIAIPDGVDPKNITTGIVIDADGTVRHVPTKIVGISGKYYAKMKSLTNSTYSIIWHPIEFKDVAKHWAKDTVNDMGSRMIISGIGTDLFNPDQDITRAELAAIVVRGLGLKQVNGAAPFVDVNPSDWFNGAIQTAYSYKLIDGFSDGSFRPLDKITREQAMTIIAKAMTITKLKPELSSNASEELISPFTDASMASEWAKNGIAECLQAGIVSGRQSSELAPKGNITRAEVAIIIQKLLLKSELI